MKDEIAVLLDANNNLTDIFNIAWLVIYKKTDKWEVINKVSLNPCDKLKKDEITEFMNQLIEELHCCKCVVGGLVVGMPYFLLSKAGYEIFEAEELSEKLLEQIYEDYIVTKKEIVPKLDVVDIPKQPIAINEEGDYFLDFISLQKAYPAITSKKALLPFFSEELYKSITIICSHVMPWLETFMEEHHLEATIDRKDGRYTVVVSHKCCQ